MIEVATGVLFNAQDRVLLMQRLPGTHLAGLWEFPGGKRETGETIEYALTRELHEELGIEVRAIEPLITVPWRYPEKSVRLHAFRVTDWRGDMHAREGHPLRWMLPDEMDPDAMPAADRPILTALRLPLFYVITPSHLDSAGAGACLQATGASGLLQLRLPERGRDEVRAIAQTLRAHVPSMRGRLLINHDIELARELGIGVHLRAAQLRELKIRPLPNHQWVGASCHDAHELQLAANLGADFATLSPVDATSSHSNAQTLGWDRLAQLVAEARLPVYALGGMVQNDLTRARGLGAQGIAGISAFSA